MKNHHVSHLSLLLLLHCLFVVDVGAVMRPLTYRVGDNVKLRVNKLTSVQTLFPLSHYHVPFCQPEQGVKGTKQNWGQHLTGDEIRNSPYALNFGTDMYCQVLCVSHVGRAEKPNLPWQQQSNHMVQAIHRGFKQNWLIGDGLPAAWRDEDNDYLTTRFIGGFPVGFVGKDDHRAYVYNHVNIIIHYHPVHAHDGDDQELEQLDVKEEYRIVQFIVQPFSIKHKFHMADRQVVLDEPTASCQPHASTHTNFVQLYYQEHVKPQLASGKVLFTYDVVWEENLQIHWSNRWDVYLMNDTYVPYHKNNTVST